MNCPPCRVASSGGSMPLSYGPSLRLEWLRCCTALMAKRPTWLTRHTLPWVWVLDRCFGFFLWYRQRSAELLTLLSLPSTSWRKKSSSLSTDLETHHVPLRIMASRGDRGRRHYGGQPHHTDWPPPPHRAAADASSIQASPLVWWVFTLCRHLPGLASLPWCWSLPVDWLRCHTKKF
jgi:hypothetical protein